MEDPRHAQGPANNVLGIGQRILTTLVGIAETRVRLAVVELEEESEPLPDAADARANHALRRVWFDEPDGVNHLGH